MLSPCPLILALMVLASPPADPAGVLGMDLVERPNEPIHLHSRHVPTQPDIVVSRVHPGGLAEWLGIRAGDVLGYARIMSKGDVEVGFSIDSVGDAWRVVEAVRSDANARRVTLFVLRPVAAGAAPDSGDLWYGFPATRLR